MPTPTVRFNIKATDRTKGVFRAVKRSLAGISKSLFSFKTAIGLAAGAAGLGLLITKSLQATDRIGKLSKTYGIATKQLGAFNLAAKLGGTNLETFARAARNVSKNVFDFVVRDTGEAKDAFVALGISAEDLKPIMNDNVALIGRIADEFNKMEDGAIKTALAVKLLGGRAVELLPALAGGSEGFARIALEADRFGIALSTRAVRNVEKANDEFTRLTSVFKGLTDQTVAALSPAFSALFTNIRNFILELADSQGGIEQFAQNIAVKILGVARSAIDGLERLKDATASLRSFLGLATEDEKRLTRVVMGLEAIRDEINETNSALEGRGGGFLSRFFKEDQEALLALQVQNVAAAESLLDELERLQSAADPFEVARTGLDEMIETIRTVKSELPIFGPRPSGAGGPALSGDTTETETEEGKAFEIFKTRLDERIEKLRESFLTEEEMLTLSLETKQELVDEAAEFGRITVEEGRELELQLEARHQKRLASVRIKSEKIVSSSITAMRRNVFSQSVGLLRALAGESKTAAIVVIALEKGLGIAQTIINTQVAMMRALAELGPIAGPPAAAIIAKLGAVSIGLIAATGLAQAGAIGSGGANLGTASNPAAVVGSTGSSVPVPPAGELRGPARTVTIIIQRGAAIDEETLRDEVAPLLEEMSRDGALVIDVQPA